MAEIYTIHGMMDEALLQYHEEVTDDDNEYAVAMVWELNDEIVKRSVHVTLKSCVEMQTETESF